MIWEIRLNGGRNIYLGEWVIVKQMVNIIRTRWERDIPPGPLVLGYLGILKIYFTI